jgi:D-cysteine desulfhydrase
MMKIPNKLNISNLPTPVQEIKFEGAKFLLKRDDFTGMEFSGNKIRKLDYLLYEAVKRKSEYIFTCGGDQSNHARATAVAAVKYGIKPVLFLWGKDKPGAEGNLFINKILGAEIKYLSGNEYHHVNEIMTDEWWRFEKQGKSVYVIPEGGSSTLGIWGYINFVNELMQQTDITRIKRIFVAAGSGGTAAGLLCGIFLNKLKCEVNAVNVLYPEDVIRKKILRLTDACRLEFKIDIEINPDKLKIIDGYSKEGYKKINPDKVKLIKRFAESTGIILDPAYTGKAFNAFYDLVISKNVRDVLFIHTGGLFGVFGKRKEYLAV